MAEILSFGMRPEDMESAPVEIWPENWDAWELFGYMQTQWRMGPGGATGLDYSVMHHKMDRMKLDPDEFEQLEDDIRTMEFAALSAMAEKA